MDTSLLAVLGLGLLLGVRHATDADHVVAVSTLVSQHRSVARSCLLGAFWGMGHTLALLLAGIGVIVFRLTITPEVERGLETAVALMLILLGGHALLRSLGSLALDRHAHTHDGLTHRHVHVHLGSEDTGHLHLVRLGGRPFLVGLLHGLAGSAALTLLVLATIPSPVAGFLYMLVFGVGSTAGMLLLSGLIGIPFVAAGGRSARAQTAVQALAGSASMLLGLALVAGVISV